MPTLVRQWTPHPTQREILADPTRFRLIAAGRRFGKTTLAANHAFEYAITHPDSHVWWVAPTYGDANELGFDNIKALVPEALMAKPPKRTAPRKIYLVNGSVISFRSGEREDSLRGRGLDFLVIDEAGSVPDNSWRAELRPSLSDTMGSMLAIGTPRGEGWFKEWHGRGDDPKYDNVSSFQATTYDNPHVPDSEVEAARSELPERVFRQEYLAEFMDDEGAVFGNVRERNIESYDMAETLRLSDGPFSIGIDLARTRNYLVAIALNEDGRIVKFHRDRGGTWGRLRTGMETFLADLEPGTVRIDASRDNAVIEELDAAVPQYIEPVKFGGGKKNELIENLAARLELGTITIDGRCPARGRNEPADELASVVSELEAYGYETTRAGNITYGPNGAAHDDCVDALALAAVKPKVQSATW